MLQSSLTKIYIRQDLKTLKGKNAIGFANYPCMSERYNGQTLWQILEKIIIYIITL